MAGYVAAVAFLAEGGTPVIANAITVRAPWALAIASGFKDVENRTRQVHYRGQLAVHTAATWCRLGGQDPRIRSWWWGEQNWQNQGPLDGTEFPNLMRRIVAVTTVAGCHRAEPGCCESRWGDQPNTINPVVWHVELADTEALLEPVGPVRGSLSLPWQLPPDVAEKVQHQLDDRLMDALAAAAVLGDSAPADLADQVLARVQDGGSAAWKASQAQLDGGDGRG
ncbi:hypothetical protein K1W54_04890 [Micromonospora sp. CPCC 205371]|nr:hypothetical protein [Micromonospora sp. CPCC 205371]